MIAVQNRASVQKSSVRSMLRDFRDRTGCTNENGDIAQAMATLSKYYRSRRQALPKLEKLLLSLGDETPVGNTMAICTGLKLFQEARTSEIGLQRLGMLAKTNIRGSAINVLVGKVYSGNLSMALAGIHVGAAEFDLNQFVKESSGVDLRR
jgi:hypothetical protein